MSRRKRKRAPTESKLELDLTAMIDVVFNLLIFFLCSPFKIPEGQLDAFLPRDVGMQMTEIKKEQEMVVVKLQDAHGNIPVVYVGKTRLLTNDNGEPRFDILAARLEAMDEMSDESIPVQIDSDPKVEYRYVIGVLNACTEARIEDVRFTLPAAQPGG